MTNKDQPIGYFIRSGEKYEILDVLDSDTLEVGSPWDYGYAEITWRAKAEGES